MKSKFQNFDFGTVEVLSREESAKVKGGAYGFGQYGGGGGFPGGITTSITCGCDLARTPGARLETVYWAISIDLSMCRDNQSKLDACKLTKASAGVVGVCHFWGVPTGC